MSRRAWIALLATLPMLTAAAAEPCSYKWNVTREVQLFTTAPAPATASTEAGTAPAISTGRLYELTLQPQQSVRFVVPPTKQMLADGMFGGLLKFRVATAGPYRIAIDAGFWLDVVHAGMPLESADFNGNRDCPGPRKIVVYDLPAGSELVLQVAAATSSTAKLTVTPVEPPAP